PPFGCTLRKSEIPAFAGMTPWLGSIRGLFLNPAVVLAVLSVPRHHVAAALARPDLVIVLVPVHGALDVGGALGAFRAGIDLRHAAALGNECSRHLGLLGSTLYHLSHPDEFPFPGNFPSGAISP